MGLTITLVDSGEGQFGQLRYQIATVLFDSSYPTGGEALPTGSGGTPSVGGIQNVLGMIQIGAKDATGAGIMPVYKPSTGKILAMRVTATGTIAVTDGAVTVVGGGIGEAIGINPDTNAGVLSKAAATTRTIPQATFGIAATTAVLTGTSASLVEVSNGVSLSTVQVTVMFLGV